MYLGTYMKITAIVMAIWVVYEYGIKRILAAIRRQRIRKLILERLESAIHPRRQL